MKKNLPKTIKVTISRQETTTPWDAFYDALNYILTNKKGKIRKIAEKAKEKLCGNESINDCCKAAFAVIQDEPTIYTEMICDDFPPELWELLDKRF